MDGVTITHTDLGDHGTYYAHVEGSKFIGRLEWTQHDNVRVIEHTVVPPEIGGRGIAGVLLDQVIADARASRASRSAQNAPSPRVNSRNIRNGPTCGADLRETWGRIPPAREEEMVLPVRIELTTSALPRMRSTTELRQPTISGRAGRANGPVRQARAIGGGGGACQALLRCGRTWA